MALEHDWDSWGLVSSRVVSSMQTLNQERTGTEEQCMVVKREGLEVTSSRHMWLLLVYPRLQGSWSWCPFESCSGLSFNVLEAVVYKLLGVGTRDVFLFCNFCSFFICFLFWLKNGLLLLALSSLCAVYTWLLPKRPLPHLIYLLLQVPI